MRGHLRARYGERGRLIGDPGRKRAAFAALFLTTLLAAGAAPGAAQPTAGTGNTDREAIQALLDARADAFLDRDKGAFLETIDPRAKGFRRSQARMFGHARGVPFERYRLIADWERLGDLARPRDVDAYPGAGAVSIPLTQERYRIDGFDTRDAVEDAYFTFVEREGQWFIAADDDLAALGLLTVRHVWDLGPVEVTRSRHFMGLGPPCSPATICLEDLLGLAEEALTQVDRYWKVPWSHRVVLIVPPSDEGLRRMLQATFDPGKFVAFAYSTIEPETQRYTGHRIIVNPPVIGGRDRDEVLTIMAHELLHIATRGASGPFIPLFVDEGFAEIAGYAGRSDSLSYFDAIVGSGAFDNKLPLDFEFSTGSGDEIFLSYQEAQSAIAHFIDRWGLKRFTTFYRRLGRQRIASGSPSWHVQRALRRTIDVGLRGFERSWTSSIDS